MLAGGSLPDEETAPERVGFAVLFQHRQNRHFHFAFHLHSYRRVSREGNALRLGLQPVVVLDPYHDSGVVNTDEYDAAGGVGEGAGLHAKVGGQGCLNSVVNPSPRTVRSDITVLFTFR